MKAGSGKGKGSSSPKRAFKVPDRDPEPEPRRSKAQPSHRVPPPQAPTRLRAIEGKAEPKAYDPRKFRIPAHDDARMTAQYGYKASPRYGAIMSEIIYSREFPELTNPGYFQRAAIHHFIEYLQSVRPSTKVQSALAELGLINQMLEEEEQLLHLIATIEKLSKLVEKYKALNLNASAARVAFQARRHVEAMPKKDKEIKDYLDTALKIHFGDLYNKKNQKLIESEKKARKGLLRSGSEDADEHEIESANRASDRLAELQSEIAHEDETAADERDVRKEEGEDDDDGGDWIG